MTTADLVTFARQRFGQRADHVGQPAGFGIRVDFAARQQNSHANRTFKLQRSNESSTVQPIIGRATMERSLLELSSRHTEIRSVFR